MRMVQPALHEIIRVVPVRHGFMTAAGTVLVFGGVARPGRVAAIRVGGAHRQRVLVVVTFMRMMQVAVMEKIDVPVVLDRRVAAAGPVLMIVMFVGVVFVRHEGVLSLKFLWPGHFAPDRARCKHGNRKPFALTGSNGGRPGLQPGSFRDRARRRQSRMPVTAKNGTSAQPINQGTWVSKPPSVPKCSSLFTTPMKRAATEVSGRS
jgi:hypothetical protein